ncbi:hypothetical protein Nepgr_033713 [Nepenthes gracilis]|uniref:Uncharacterized protein n=1 Tax=Nepenthes gracilis TaxID=150966 RepID=A0AAD3TMB2_NEPGR|nr:hypothetical protein Nepgr_033713 [Nepenthes gracilis]
MDCWLLLRFSSRFCLLELMVAVYAACLTELASLSRCAAYRHHNVFFADGSRGLVAPHMLLAELGSVLSRCAAYRHSLCLLVDGAGDLDDRLLMGVMLGLAVAPQTVCGTLNLSFLR